MTSKWIAPLLLAASGVAFAQTTAPPSPPVRLRGTVERLDAQVLVIKERGGQTITLPLADNFAVNEVVAIDPSAIQTGAFIGTAAVPGADGRLSALEVLVFPEAARGNGEGHYPWDLQADSTMTNGTVAQVAPGAAGKTMTLKYKDGEKTIVVPDGVPVVTVKPGDRSLLVPGAKVVVFSQSRDGKPTALRALAGRDGFAPPM